MADKDTLQKDNKDAQESGQPVQLDKEPHDGQQQHGASHEDAAKPGGEHKQKQGGSQQAPGQAGE